MRRPFSEPEPSPGVHRPKEGIIPNPQSPLREQVREVLRFHHYAWRTEQAYWCWIVRFFRLHRHPERSGSSGWQHPRTLGVAEVAGFLSHFAIDRKVAAATQDQALNALVFLYAEVLHQPVGDLDERARLKLPKRLPVVLTRAEVRWMRHEIFEPRSRRGISTTDSADRNGREPL